MSFTSEVKAEVAQNLLHACCEKAQLSALIQICSTLSFTNRGIHIVVKSENVNTAKRIWKLVKERYHVESELSVLRKMKLKKNNVYVIRIVKQAKEILEDLELFSEKGLRTHPSAAMVKKECCARAYLAGAFLAGGSINSPQTSNYHLELTAGSEELAKFIQKLMNRFHLPAKYIIRRHQHVVYLKASDKISDFLRCIGASDALFSFEDSRIQRDFMNSLTRLDNCEVANEMRSLKAGAKQLEAIAWIENFQSLESLPEKIKEVALLRKAYPESSLNELCELYHEAYQATITKSGMKHRLSKIREIANQYRSE